MSEAHWGEDDMLEVCTELYQSYRDGQAAVISYCDSIDHPDWGLCEDCECTAPFVHKDEEKKCLICSFGNVIS